MANLRFRLTVITVGLVLIALALGWFAPMLMAMLPEQVTTVHLLSATFVFVGLCGLAFYSLMERALNPVMRLIDTFTRMHAGDLNPRLPVEGPEEMRRMARGFNDMIEDLETQIRDIEVEKQSAERARQLVEEQLTTNHRFRRSIDAAPIGIVITDERLRVVYQNPASESGFLQLESFDEINPPVVGKSITRIYPDDLDVEPILSDPDRLPFDTDVTVGPHCLHFLTSATFDEDEEFAGIVLIWEETERLGLLDDVDDLEFSEAFVDDLEDSGDLDFNEYLEPVDSSEGIDEDILTEVEELETFESEPSFEMVDDFDDLEEEPIAVQNGVHGTAELAPNEFRRNARLVKRSIGLLAERLDGVMTSVDALCDEGESLHRAVEDIRDQAGRTNRLTLERSEPLRDLIEDRKRASKRKNDAAALSRSLKKGLSDAVELGQTMNRLGVSIEHLVISSKVEFGRMSGETGGARVVVDAIGDLGEEARRLGESTRACIRDLSDRLDDVIDLVKQEGDAAGLEERLGTRAEHALARIEEELGETSQRNDLLSEMVRGQAEIAQHIAKQIEELGELVTLTSKVAVKQVEIAEGPA